MRGDDDGFAGFVALLNDFFLQDGDGGEVHFHAEVSAGDEDGVGGFVDSGEVLHGFGHFVLGVVVDV